MKAIWLLSLSNIRKKKLQNGLIVVLILLSTLLLSTAGSIILNTRDTFTKLHNEVKGSHQILMLEKGIHDKDKVYQWWSSQKGVNTSVLTPYQNFTGIYSKGVEIQNIYLYMMDSREQITTVDKLVFAEGKESLVPEKGTVWIPSSLAYSNGIKAGDLLEFGTGTDKFKLTVAAVVIDLPFCAPFSNGARIWMNDDDYISQIAGIKGENEYMFGIRYEDYKERNQYWTHFEEFLGTPYLENVKSFEDISAFYLIMNKIIGFIMIFLGMAMIVIALYTIGFTITEAILSEYKTLGIVKSLGLSSADIIGSYILQYALLCVVSILPGVIVSSRISGLIVDASLSYIKTDNLQVDGRGGNVGAIVGVSVFLLIMLFTFIRSGKIKSVQPVQAIRYGMSEMLNSRLTRQMGAGGTKLNFEKYPIPFVIGARNLLKSGKTAILMLVLTSITSAVVIFGIVFLNSLLNIYKTAPLWGYDSSNVAVMFYNPPTNILKSFEKDIKADPRIKNAGWYSGTTGVFQTDKKAGTPLGTPMNVNMDVIKGSFNELGYAVLKGRNPENKNEIALGINVSRQLHRDVGDLAEVYIEGEKYTLTIVGVYQAIANMSNSARITADVLKPYTTDYSVMETCFINLKDVRDSDALVEEINTKYKNSLTAVTQKALIEDVYSEAVAMLVIPMLFIGILFISATLIIIYSTCRISIRKESKTYGIYKSLGLTTVKIRVAIMGGIAAMTLVGTVVGIVAGTYLLPMLMERILSDYGIVKLPLIINGGSIILAAIFITAAVCVGSWFSTASVRSASPKILIIE